MLPFVLLFQTTRTTPLQLASLRFLSSFQAYFILPRSSCSLSLLVLFSFSSSPLTIPTFCLFSSSIFRLVHPHPPRSVFTTLAPRLALSPSTTHLLFRSFHTCLHKQLCLLASPMVNQGALLSAPVGSRLFGHHHCCVDNGGFVVKHAFHTCLHKQLYSKSEGVSDCSFLCTRGMHQNAPPFHRQHFSGTSTLNTLNSSSDRNIRLVHRSL